jgi:molybdopterin adenylyltransferase
MSETIVKVLSVNLSEKKGTIKVPVEAIVLDKNGVQGDAHSGPWNRQVSLLAEESIQRFSHQSGRAIKYGEFAENITTIGLELHKTLPLDRLFSENIELEITQIGKECHGANCAIFREVGNCVMPKEGIFARVIRGGKLQAGDSFQYRPRVLHVAVITLSDRASRGEYNDLSGPRVVELLTNHFNGRGRPIQFEQLVLPDSAVELKKTIALYRKSNMDCIITTGGTGIGPRDITPEVVRPMLDKEIPGIMEMIRVKYGMDKPNATLSRGVAGLIGNSLVYTLPGSVKAVNEYMTEILKTLEHLIYMLNTIDAH